MRNLRSPLGGLRSPFGARGLAAPLALDLLAAPLDPRITFTRASSATRFNSSGTLGLVSTDGPRFDFDPVTLHPRGLLIEEQRTNLLVRSEEWNTLPWTNGTNTVTANTSTSPSGATNADTFTATATGVGSAARQDGTGVVSTPYTWSAFLKAGTASFGVISPFDGVDGNRRWFDLTTGTVGGSAVIGAGLISPSAAIENAQSGWFRGSVSATTRSRATLAFFGSFADANSSVTLTNGRTGLVWGAQLEAGAFPTSYIPTTTASATRAADVASMTGANFSSWFNAAQGTFLAEFTPRALSGTRTVFDATDGTTGESIRLRTVASNLFFTVTDGGVDQCNIDLGPLVVGTTYRIACAYAANDFAACVNGGPVLTDTSGSLPTVNRLLIGNSAANNFLNGHNRRLIYWPARRADLQALTA